MLLETYLDLVEQTQWLREFCIANETNRTPVVFHLCV